VIASRRGKYQNIRGLNFAVVKLMTVQVTKLPCNITRKIGMNCSAKPVLTEEFYIVQKEEL
jgi:hypothetical protein